MKPYRLINASELQQLTQQFTQILDAWNDEYCCIPLHLTLKTTSGNYPFAPEAMIYEGNTAVAGLEGNYASGCTLALFGVDKPCFYPASQELFLVILKQLLHFEECQIQTETHQPTVDWFYIGSPSLRLIINGEGIDFSLTLSPDWVHQHLPTTRLTATPLIAVDEALEEQSIRLAVELVSSSLSVKDLACMQVGDIFSTPHALGESLRLSYGKELVAQAELGQSAEHKSIVLKRTS